MGEDPKGSARNAPHGARATTSARRPEVLAFSLPWPPTVNHLWRTVDIHSRRGAWLGRRTILSAAGRRYREAAAWALIRQGVRKLGLRGRLAIAIEYRPPDLRRRDLDNLPKAVLDALVHYGLLEDDRYVKRHCSTELDPIAGGRIDVRLAAVDARSARVETPP